MAGRARIVVWGFLIASTVAVAVPSAQVGVEDGLINVAIGDVTVLHDVRVDVAARVAANICGVNVGPVTTAGRTVDRSGAGATVCIANLRPVKMEQN